MARGLLLACAALLVLDADAYTQSVFNGNWRVKGTDDVYTIATASDGVYELFLGASTDAPNSIGQGFFSSNTLAFSNAHGTVYAVGYPAASPTELTWTGWAVWEKVAPIANPPQTQQPAPTPSPPSPPLSGGGVWMAPVTGGQQNAYAFVSAVPISFLGVPAGPSLT